MVVAVVTFGSVILVGGVFLLVAATVMFLLASASAREYRTVVAAVPGPLAGRAGLVAATGVTAYGSHGPQVGPVSGADCAWYRIEVVRSPSRGSDDRTGSDVFGHFFSPGRAALTDGSGTVSIDPRVLERTLHSGLPAGTERSGTTAGPDVPGYVPRGLVGRLRSYEQIQLTEIRLPAGREIFAVGAVRGGDLTKGRAGVFTTSSRDEVVAKLSHDRSSTQALTRAFGVVGLLAVLASAGMLSLVVR